MPAFRGTLGTPSAPGGASTTATFTMGSLAAAQRAVVAVGYYDVSSGDVGLTGAGDGWTLDAFQRLGGTHHNALFSKHFPSGHAGGTLTATFDNPSGSRAICGLKLAGVAESSWVDATGSGAGGGLGGWVAPITTLSPSTLIVAFGWDEFGNSAHTPVAGWTIVEDTVNVSEFSANCLVYGFGSSPGTYSPGASNPHNGGGVSAAYKAPPDVPGDEDSLVRIAGRWVQSDEKTYVGGLWV